MGSTSNETIPGPTSNETIPGSTSHDTTPGSASKDAPTKDTPSSPTCIRIPNTLARWPWPKSVNPHMDECAAASHAWITSLGLLSPKRLRIMWAGQNWYLAALSWPHLARPGCQIGCDLLNVFWILDDTTDRCASGQAVRDLVGCFMDALRHPDKVRAGDSDEWGGAALAQSFMRRMASLGAGPSCAARLVERMQQFCDSVVAQAEDRARGRVREVDAYLEIRRHTIGVYPCYAVLEHERAVADHVYEHATMWRLEGLAADLIILDNDLLSYNKEQAVGDEGHNLVRVVMEQFGLGLQEAIDWMGERYAEVVDEFLAVYETVSVVFAGDEDAQRYAWGVGNWVRGNWQWSWEVCFRPFCLSLSVFSKVSL